MFSMSDRLGIRARLDWQADNGAGDQGSSNTSQQEGQTPADQQNKDAGQNNPNLVDVTEKDANGNLLWFPRKHVEELRAEAASARNRVRELEQKLDALSKGTTGQDQQGQQNQGQTEGQQTQNTQGNNNPPAPAPDPQLVALQERERQLRIQNAVLAAAARATNERRPFIDPEDAVRLVDLSTIKIDDTGAITGVEEAVMALAKAKPHLLDKSRRSAIGATNPGNAGSNEPPIVSRLRKRMQGQTGTFGEGGVVISEE